MRARKMRQTKWSKRTFETMIAIILVLTLTIHPVFSNGFREPFVEMKVRAGLFTTMRLRKENWGTTQDLANPVGTDWDRLFAISLFPYTITSWTDNGDGVLSPGDQIVLQHQLTEDSWDVEWITRGLISDHFVMTEKGFAVTDSQFDDALNTFESSLSIFRNYGFRNPEPIADGEALPIRVRQCDTGCAHWKYDLGFDFWIEIPPSVFSMTPNEHIMLHELFHEVQFAYPGGSEVFGQNYANWVIEGQARMMQDKTFLDADLWDGSETASYWGEVQNYLSNTDVTLGDLSYRAALFWTYFTEQVGSWTTEPGYGIDALVEWWRHASDEYGGGETTRRALSVLKPAWSFESLWKKFIVANYLKDFGNVLSKDQYVDQAQYEAAHGHGPFWDPVRGWHFPRVHFTVDSVLHPNGLIQGSDHIDKWAARYYRIEPSPNVDLVRIFFTSNHDLSYHLIAVRGGRVMGAMGVTGKHFSKTIANRDYDEIVVVVGGLERGSNYLYSIKSLTPTIDIIWPTTESPVRVGGNPPTEDFWLSVRVVDQTGRPIRGLQSVFTGQFPPDIDIRVARMPALWPSGLSVTVLQELDDLDLDPWWETEANYALLIHPPTLPSGYTIGAHDLTVGIGNVVVTESGAIDYSTDELEPPQLEMILSPVVLGLPELKEEKSLQGKPIDIRVSLTERNPIIGAGITAKIITPPLETPLVILPSETYYITLYDDGEHGDGAADDGVYGNVFYRTSRPGTYTIEAVAEGVAPEIGGFEKNVTTAFSLRASLDSDGDGLPDWWEEEMGLDPKKPGGDHGVAGDPDMDGLENAEEFRLGPNPTDSDTDSGGESDGSEVAAGRDPNNPSDDTIPSVLDFDVRPGNGFNLVVYSIKPEYQDVLIWRSTNAKTSYELIAEGFYPKGIYNDTTVENGVTYYYRIAAKGPTGEMTRIEFPESATPKTDVDPPRGFITINDGEETTYSQDVKLTLYSDPDTTDMMISNDPRFTEAQWEPYETSKDWRLQGTGLQTVYIRFRDAADNVAVEIHDSIKVLTDTVPPTIVHAPVATGNEGQAITITATITDNVAVTDATLFYRKTGETTYTSLTMTKTGDTYTATIPASAVTTDGVQYYINATDGTNFTTDPTTNPTTSPHTITISAENLPPTAVTLNNPSDITEDSMKLTWTANSDADFAKYEIYMSNSSGTLGTLIRTITNGSTTSYAATNLAADTTYYFTIRTVDTGGLFADSNQASGKTAPSVGGFPLMWLAIIVIIVAVITTMGVLMVKRKKPQNARA